MTIRFATILAMSAYATIELAAQPTPTLQERVHVAPADRVSVQRMSNVPAVEVAPGVQVRTVIGTTGSFSIADFRPGSAGVLHHHTREQILRA